MIVIPVKEGENIERALKQLKGKFIRTKVPKECRERQQHTKKSVKRRAEKIKAAYLQKKYDQEN